MTANLLLYRARESERLRGSIWALSDQAVVSATNFATVVFLGRASTPNALGSFALAYMVLLFAGSWQTALITQPHNVLGAVRSGDEYVAYTSATAVLQALMAVMGAILALLAAYIAQNIGFEAAKLLLLVAPVIVVWQFQEFVRRVLFTRSEVRAVLQNDFLTYGGRFAGVLLLWRTETLTPHTAMGALFVAFLLGTIYGFWQVRSHLALPVSLGELTEASRECWRFGRWLLGTAMLNWTSDAAYPLLVAVMVGVTATGEMRAAETIATPVQTLAFAMGSLFIPRAAVMFASGGAQLLSSFLRTVLVATAPIVLVFCSVTLIFPEQMLRLLYGDQYAQLAWLVGVMLINAVIHYIRSILSIALRAVGATNALFFASIWLSSCVYLIGVPLIHLYELRGLAVAMIVASCIGTVAQWSYLKGLLGSEASPPR